MAKFKLSSSNLTDKITYFFQQYATESKYSVIGFIDSALDEFILAPCDAPLDVNSEIRIHQSASHALSHKQNMSKPRKGRQFPIVYDAVSSVTSDEVYREVSNRYYAPARVLISPWIMFGIHYDARHPNELHFSSLPFDLTGAVEDGFVQGLKGTKCELQFLRVQTTIIDAVHRIELDKLVKLRIPINKSIHSLSEFSGRVSQKKSKEEAQFRPIAIDQDCLDCQTLEIFKIPVVAVDGHLYDRHPIESWFEKTAANPTSPLTNEPLYDKTLVPFQLLENILKRPTHEIFVEDLICPLTNRFMKEPVLASNGVLYEREAILKEFDKNPPSEKIKDIKSRQLISMPWVNNRRDELTKQNPQVLNPIRPPAEVAMKSTHSAVLTSFQEEEKKLHNQGASEQEPKTSRQIYKVLMDGVSFSRLRLQEKTTLINAIMQQNDADQQHIFSDLRVRHIHIFVDMLNVHHENLDIFERAKMDSDRFKQNLEHARIQQLESIRNKHSQMSKTLFSTLQTDSEKIKYVYRLCTFNDKQLDHLFTAQACFSPQNLCALNDFLPVVFKRYRIPRSVELAVAQNLQKHLKLFQQDHVQRHQREKEQKEQDNRKMHKPNDQLSHPSIKSASPVMYASGVRSIQKSEPSVMPATRGDADERNRLRAFQRT